jgi:hypothetical protein
VSGRYGVISIGQSSSFSAHANTVVQSRKEADRGNTELIAAVQGADDRLKAVNTINAVTNSKVRGITGHFCEISETFLGRVLFALIKSEDI